MFVSLHDSDHDGIVRIFVALSCELWSFFILYYITRHNLLTHCWGWPTAIQIKVKTGPGCLEGEGGALNWAFGRWLGAPLPLQLAHFSIRPPLSGMWMKLSLLPKRLVNRRMRLSLAAARKYGLIICMRLLTIISMRLLTIISMRLLMVL